MRSVVAGRRPHTMAQNTTEGKPTQCRRPHNLPCTWYKARGIQFDDKPPFNHRSVPSRTSFGIRLPLLTSLLSDKRTCVFETRQMVALDDQYSTKGLKTCTWDA